MFSISKLKLKLPEGHLSDSTFQTPDYYTTKNLPTNHTPFTAKLQTILYELRAS